MRWNKMHLVLGVCICVAFVLFSAFAGADATLASATTIYVPDNYAKIQWAVDNASTGNTIIVRDGTYYENVIVNKQLTIKSENGSDNCIVDGGGSGNVITLNADGITIEGFTVRNSGRSWPYMDAGIKVVSNSNKIAYNSITNNVHGIALGGSNNNIYNNTVSSNNWDGISLYSSSNNSITNNVMNSDGIVINGYQLQPWNTHTIEGNIVNGKPLYYFKNKIGGKVPEDAGQVILANCTGMRIENLNISNTDVGVQLGFSSHNIIKNNRIYLNNVHGIDLVYSSNNNIYNNTANSNSGDGIHLGSSSNNNIYNNIASNNLNGIDLVYSSNNNIYNNTANSNSGDGIYLWGSSNNNKIYLNNFINNTDQIGSYYSTNIWNSTSKITYTYNGSTYTNYLGNYWSDYTGSDADGDGIGDTPYSIDGDKDYYPLMERFEDYIGIPKLTVNIVTPPEGFSTIAGSELTVKAKVLDEEILLHNATVEGKLSSVSFNLYDDGKGTHGDDVEDDGIYSAKIIVPKVQNAVLVINARYGEKSGSASRNINIDTSPKQPLKVEAEIIDDNPPTFTGDTVKVRAVVSLNGSIISDAEVKSTIIYPNSSQKNITLQNKDDYYEATFDRLS